MSNGSQVRTKPPQDSKPPVGKHQKKASGYTKKSDRLEDQKSAPASAVMHWKTVHKIALYSQCVVTETRTKFVAVSIFKLHIRSFNFSQTTIL